jgi:hypothetical protein
VHDPAHAVAIVGLGDDEPRMAAGDAQLQCGLDVLRGVDGDHGRNRRHHLARLLLVQMEDARKHPGLAEVDVPAGVRLGDQPLELIRRSAAAFLAHVDAEHPQDPVGDGRQRDDQRVKQDAERVQRSRDATRDRLGTVDRVELRHHLTGDELCGGDDRERHDRRDRDGRAVGERAAERALEHVSERGLAECADADRSQRHADLHG